MPGEMGPNGAWEDRTRETGLPLVVCNRTGVEEDMDWREAESVAIQGGQRVMNHFGPGSRLLRVDLLLDHRTWSSAGREPLAF
jgi:N-carbamoylputrescine amidase